MDETPRNSYLDATQEAGKALYMRQITGSVVMLNLLKFKEKADYSGSMELAPRQEISGKEAYQLYIDHTLPFLEEAGGEIRFQGRAGSYLIGPAWEDWDAALLVRHESVATFIAFASNNEYLRGIGHRTAALEDSRLLPIEEES